MHSQAAILVSADGTFGREPSTYAEHAVDIGIPCRAEPLTIGGTAAVGCDDQLQRWHGQNRAVCVSHAGDGHKGGDGAVYRGDAEAAHEVKLAPRGSRAFAAGRHDRGTEVFRTPLGDPPVAADAI